VASGHAYSTVTENAAYAASIGLTHIGVSDHGPGMPGGSHEYYFGNIWILPEEICGVRVIIGTEANISDQKGKLDLPDWILKRLEFVIASMHRGVIPPQDKAFHTKAMINAMENPYVNILGHPGDIKFDIDFEAVVAAAARTLTIIEINNQSLNPGSIRYNGDEPFLQLLELCKRYEVPVIASSDAHFHTQVGQLDRAKELIEASGIDPGLVLNTSADLFFNAVHKKRTKK